MRALSVCCPVVHSAKMVLTGEPAERAVVILEEALAKKPYGIFLNGKRVADASNVVVVVHPTREERSIQSAQARVAAAKEAEAVELEAKARARAATKVTSAKRAEEKRKARKLELAHMQALLDERTCPVCEAKGETSPMTCDTCRAAIPSSDDPRWSLWLAVLLGAPELRTIWKVEKVSNLDAYAKNLLADKAHPLPSLADFARVGTAWMNGVHL